MIRPTPLAMMRPGETPAAPFGVSLRRLMRLLHPQKLPIACAMLLAVAGMAASVIGPRLLGHGTDLIYAGLRAPGAAIDFAGLAHVLAIALGIYLGAAACQWLQAILLSRAVQRTVYDLREHVEAKLHRIPPSYFDKQKRGDLLSRVTNDVDNVAQALQQTLSVILTSLLSVVGVTAMMIFMSPLMALIALVTIPAAILLTKAIARRSQKLFARQWASLGQLNAQIEESFTGHMLIKLFGRGSDAQARFVAHNQELFDASFRGQVLSSLALPMTMLIGSLNYVAVAVVGALRVASGAMTLGEVQAFIQYSRMLTQPISQLASIINMAQSGVASAARVFELLDAPEESVEPEADGLSLHGRVAFEDISFAYDPARPLIEHLSLVAEPGHTVAIVGPTGAGKTTLVNLLMRFYELDAGRITIDGVDIASVPRQALRRGIGMVLQDSWLFRGTIAENIAYGRPDATEAEVHAAADAAFVSRFVHSLPAGFDTVIDEDGGNISAGEKQLITIARAFLADPALLILDEATSAIDTRTELLVQRAMAALRSDRTCFVIAHRLSTIHDADLILVMENGRIVEQGDHETLIATRGRYHALHGTHGLAEA
jgi:ATP-binding cassette subfamily B multidrug efflux pump